jgi:hypothetical protein
MHDPETQKLVDRLEQRTEGGDWRKAILLMYDGGVSDFEVMRVYKLRKQDWNRLMNDTVTSDFAEVIDFGRILAQAWWMEQGRVGLGKKGFNTNLWNINMQNRWGWSTKTEDRQPFIEELKNMDDAELSARFHELREKYINNR